MVASRISFNPMVRSSGTPSSPSSNEGEGSDSEASSIERIEQRTKASIDKLKHILCDVKARPGDASLDLLMYPRVSAQADSDTSISKMNNLRSGQNHYASDNRKHAEDEVPTPLCSRIRSKLGRRVQRLQDLGLLEESPYETTIQRREGCDNEETEELSGLGASVQHDPLTSTRTVVKFHKATRTTTVTIVASVKNPADKGSDQEPVENYVALAARALGRSAAVLEEKAQSVKRNADPHSDASESLATTDQVGLDHDRLVSQLEKSRIVEGSQVRKGYYAGTPFRPVYKVKLVNPDGSTLEALVKPATPGDVHCHWGNASSDWVAYKVGRLLETDMVPPGAMRRDVKVGDKTFPLATLLYFVPNVKPLTRLSLQEWGGDLPPVFVSNAHILDALLGSCPRARNMFMEGMSWTQKGARQAMLLDHPMGPGQGKLHPMWTQRGQIGGIKCVSGSTLARLRSLNKDVLSDAFEKWVTSAEIDSILERLRHILLYFDDMARLGNRALTVV